MQQLIRCIDCGVGQYESSENTLVVPHGWRDTEKGLVCRGCRPDYDPEKRLASLHVTVDDMVRMLLYNGRKEDEDLPRGSIQKLVADGHTTYEAIAERFTVELLNQGAVKG